MNMILIEEIKKAAMKFTVEHYKSFTETDVQLITAAMSVGGELALKKSKEMISHLHK